MPENEVKSNFQNGAWMKELFMFRTTVVNGFLSRDVICSSLSFA